MNTLSIISSLMFGLIKGDGSSWTPPSVPYGSMPISTVDLNCGTHSASLTIPLKGMGVIYFTPTKGLDGFFDVVVPVGESITVTFPGGMLVCGDPKQSAVCRVPVQQSSYGGYYTKGGYGKYKPLRIPITVTVNQPKGGGYSKPTRRLASGSYGGSYGGYKPAPAGPTIIIDRIKCTSKYAPPMAPLVTYARGPVSTIDLNCNSHSGTLSIPLNGFGVIFFRPNGNNYQYTITIGSSGHKITIERGFGLSNINCNYYSSTCVVSIPASAYSKSGAYRIPAIITAMKYSGGKPPRRLASGYTPPAYTPPAYYPPPSANVFISNIQCTKPYGGSKKP